MTSRNTNVNIPTLFDSENLHTIDSFKVQKLCKTGENVRARNRNIRAVIDGRHLALIGKFLT